LDLELTTAKIKHIIENSIIGRSYPHTYVLKLKYEEWLANFFFFFFSFFFFVGAEPGLRSPDALRPVGLLCTA
jgi:hypothetical protein